MIRHDATPISNRSRLRPIELRPIWPAETNTGLAKPYLDQAEADRIWELIVEVSR